MHAITRSNAEYFVLVKEKMESMIVFVLKRFFWRLAGVRACVSVSPNHRVIKLCAKNNVEIYLKNPLRL